MTHMLENLTHKMEGHPSKKEVSWVLGIYTPVKTPYKCHGVVKVPARIRGRFGGFSCVFTGEVRKFPRLGSALVFRLKIEIH